jgi:hypothetical protein
MLRRFNLWFLKKLYSINFIHSNYILERNNYIMGLLKEKHQLTNSYPGLIKLRFFDQHFTSILRYKLKNNQTIRPYALRKKVRTLDCYVKMKIGQEEKFGKVISINQQQNECFYIEGTVEKEITPFMTIVGFDRNIKKTHPNNILRKMVCIEVKRVTLKYYMIEIY